jgi:hypothetical protein
MIGGFENINSLVSELELTDTTPAESCSGDAVTIVLRGLWFF